MELLFQDIYGISSLIETPIETEYITHYDFKKLKFTGINPLTYKKDKILEQGFVTCNGCPCEYRLDMILAFVEFAQKLGLTFELHFPKITAPMYIETNRKIKYAVAPRIPDNQWGQ